MTPDMASCDGRGGGQVQGLSTWAHTWKQGVVSQCWFGTYHVAAYQGVAGTRCRWNNTGRLSRVCSWTTQTFAQPPPPHLRYGCPVSLFPGERPCG